MSIYFCAKCDRLRDSDFDLPEVIDGEEICETCQETIGFMAWQYEYEAKQDYFCEKGEEK